MTERLNAAYEFLTRERSWRVLCLGVALVTLVVVVLMLGRRFILGVGPYWEHSLFDASAHMSGWLYYKADSWHWPLFETFRAGYPDGVSIIMSDSIPLVALFAKALFGWVQGSWHYFGVFVLASYVLNSVALLWTLRQARVSNIIGALFAIVFAVCSTFYNIQFESLFAQFFVIFSIGFYLRLRRQHNAKVLGIFVAMVLASLLVHPYLFAMSAVLLCVTIVQLWRDGKLSVKAAGIWLGVFLVATATLFMLSGYNARQTAGAPDKLYGLKVVALDLGALFNRQYNVIEIGTYAGTGFWILFLTGLWIVRKRLRPFLAQHAVLTVALVLLLLYAITNTVYVAGHEILHIDLPDPVMAVLEMFRASRRFVLVLYYVIAIMAVVLAVRYKSKWAVAAVLVALVAQVADNSYFIREQYAVAREGVPAILDRAQYQKQLQDVKYVYTFPSYACMANYGAPLSTHKQWNASIELYQGAAYAGKISNSIRTSRRTQDCAAEAIRSQTIPAKDTLYVYIKDDNKLFVLAPSPGCQKVEEFSYGVYCRAE